MIIVQLKEGENIEREIIIINQASGV